MPLRTSPAGLIACLVPPGNIARELSLFRRSLFSGLGEALALALPDLVFLARWEGPDPREGRGKKREARLALARAWEGLSGSFSCGKAVVADGWLRLPLGGPLDSLRVGLGKAEGQPDDLPFPFAEGFLIMPLGEVEGGAGRAESLAALSPTASFHSASLGLYRFDFHKAGLKALSWSEVLAVRRPRADRPVT